MATRRVHVDNSKVQQGEFRGFIEDGGFDKDMKGCKSLECFIEV